MPRPSCRHSARRSSAIACWTNASSIVAPRLRFAYSATRFEAETLAMRAVLLAMHCVTWPAIAVPVPAAAWDYPGHRIVGAIADLVLQKHYPEIMFFQTLHSLALMPVAQVI